MHMRGRACVVVVAYAGRVASRLRVVQPPSAWLASRSCDRLCVRVRYSVMPCASVVCTCAGPCAVV